MEREEPWGGVWGLPRIRCASQQQILLTLFLSPPSCFASWRCSLPPSAKVAWLINCRAVIKRHSSCCCLLGTYPHPPPPAPQLSVTPIQFAVGSEVWEEELDSAIPMGSFQFGCPMRISLGNVEVSRVKAWGEQLLCQNDAHCAR